MMLLLQGNVDQCLVWPMTDSLIDQVWAAEEQRRRNRVRLQSAVPWIQNPDCSTTLQLLRSIQASCAALDGL